MRTFLKVLLILTLLFALAIGMVMASGGSTGVAGTCRMAGWNTSACQTDTAYSIPVDCARFCPLAGWNG
ncbi:MAG: hypothetical protein FJZ87_02480 [Chloroflexi bacterium]|nr:hypothetical protein [Chloroflexota bacterium]